MTATTLPTPIRQAPHTPRPMPTPFQKRGAGGCCAQITIASTADTMSVASITTLIVHDGRGGGNG